MTENLQVNGSTSYDEKSEPLNYNLYIPKDHPNGESHDPICDISTDLLKFQEALELVKNEDQVLIFVDWMLDEAALKSIVNHLPENTYTEHHAWKPNNPGAKSWVEYHLNKQDSDSHDRRFKFLIGDWNSTAGYEFPAIIFVTDAINQPHHPTCLQRAKAKLIIYEAPNVPRFNLIVVGKNDSEIEETESNEDEKDNKTTKDDEDSGVVC